MLGRKGLIRFRWICGGILGMGWWVGEGGLDVGC